MIAAGSAQTLHALLLRRAARTVCSVAIRCLKRMSAWQARRQFGQVLREVTRNRTSVIVESHGEAVAVVVPIDAYRSAQDRKDAFLAHMREISHQINLSEEDAEPIIAEVMRETGRSN